MDLYVIRRHSAWADREELESASATSKSVGKEMADRLRWIRTYVVDEPDGRVGSVCIYEARDPEALREHGRRVGAPSDDIRIVSATVVMNADPGQGAPNA